MTSSSSIWGVGVIFFLCFALAFQLRADNSTNSGTQGYYRFPTLFNDTIVFTAEGDPCASASTAAWRNGSRRIPALNMPPHFRRTEKRSLSPPTMKGRLTSIPCRRRAGCRFAALTRDATRKPLPAGRPTEKILYSTAQYSGLPQPPVGRHRSQKRRTNHPPPERSGPRRF